HERTGARPTDPEPDVASSPGDPQLVERAAGPSEAAGLLKAADRIESDDLIEGDDLIDGDSLLDGDDLIESDDLLDGDSLLDGVDLTEPAGHPRDAGGAKAARSQRAEPASAPYGSRREARERALSLLYEADAKAITPAALLDEIPVEPPPYVTSLVSGVGERLARIDELIARYAIDWTIDRMPVVDRMVVRIATFELIGRPDVPTGVVISEAVELAKRYSTDESGRFVNGVLASIAAETRPTA
ncbi:MAG: transcription antitermination protein NusB, partial [Acidimicrobiaceae bacterium]|nr:transcription antitermination protein NusB [Acidimicrobiaceae bacterium]